MRKNYFKSFLLILSLLFFSNSVLAAKISVGTVVVDFNKNKKANYIDVPVFNDSKDEKAYVKVTVYEIKNPGTKNEKKVLLSKKNKDTLIVSPQKLIIPPKSKKNIRFISLHKNNKKDKVYRVNVAPISGKFKSESGNYIKILIAYDILTFIRPKFENSEFSVVRKGKKITFKNKGNTNILLRKAKQCSKSNPLKCKDLPGKRLYAGMTYIRSLPYDNKVEYTYSIGAKIHKKTYY